MSKVGIATPGAGMGFGGRGRRRLCWRCRSLHPQATQPVGHPEGITRRRHHSWSPGFGFGADCHSLMPPEILDVQVVFDVIALVAGIGIAAGWPIGRRNRVAALVAAFVVALGTATYSALQVGS